MKLERLSRNKIKYSITFEELSDKGFLTDEFESFIWYDLFDEMVEIAKKEYQCEITDTISIEIFSLSSMEIVLILTMDEKSMNEEQSTNHLIPTFIPDSVFCFESIEDVIQLAQCFENLQIRMNSKLMVFEDQYYLKIPNTKAVNVLCEEYGIESTMSIEMVEEYGMVIIENNALPVLLSYFNQ